jgi:uncharacterized protein (DUF58 family)
MARAKKQQRKKKQPITLRVTVAGWLFLLVGLLVGMAAVRSNMPMVFVLFGAMLGGTAISSIIGRIMIASVSVQRELTTRAWQYETVYFGYFIKNFNRRFPSLGLSLREIDPRGVEDACGYCVYLPARTMFRAGSRLTAARRGRIELRGVRLSTSFPFGLSIIRRDSPRPASIVVWPAKGHLKSDLLRHGAVQISARHPGRQQGGQDEFFGLRDYRQGDNPRWIHWRRSAGRPSPVVREMTHPVPDVLFCVLDLPAGDKDVNSYLYRERMLRFAATLMDHSLARGYQVGMALSGKTEPVIIAPGTSVGVRSSLLDTLADVSDPLGCDTEEVIASIPRQLLHSSQTLLITPHPTSLAPQRLTKLAEASRHLMVLGPEQLDELFEDHTMIRQESV